MDTDGKNHDDGAGNFRDRRTPRNFSRRARETDLILHPYTSVPVGFTDVPPVHRFDHGRDAHATSVHPWQSRQFYFRYNQPRGKAIPGTSHRKGVTLTRLSLLPLFLLGTTLLIFGGGCLICTHSSVSYADGRKPIEASKAKHIRVGITTKQWILENLGPPTSRDEVGDGIEVLHFVTTKKRRGSLHLLVIGDFEDSQETSETFFVTLKNGIVQDFGRRRL